MAANAVPNVWTQMNYIPPRGQCNWRQSIVSPKCPCLRFMLHPLKSASSYECDGCNHHASFHSMENRAEEEIRKQWAQEAKDKQETEDSRNKKRPREIEYNANVIDGIMGSLTGRLLGNGASSPVDMEIAGASRAKAKKKPVVRGTRSKGKVSEVLEEDEEYIELD